MFDPKSLYVYDPVMRLLWYMSRRKMLAIVVLAFGINGIYCLGLGGLLVFFSASHQILSPFQPETFPIEAFIYIITLPTVWIYYAQEPQRIINIIDGLYRNGVIGESQDQIYPKIEEFLKTESGIFNKASYSLLSLFFTVTMFLLWASTVFTPNNPFWFQHPQAWWEDNPLYFWLVWVPLVWGSVYMIWYTFIRRALTVRLIERFLKAFPLTPKLFHPDHANGLSPIGNYPLSFTPLIIVAGSWIFLVISYPLFFGKSINLKYDTITYILLYMMLTSVGLIAPTWKTHVLMRKVKQQVLETVAVEIRRLLSQIPSKSTGVLPMYGPIKQPTTHKEIIENVEALEREYYLLEREYHTWPFNLSSLNRFLIGTALPLFTTGISIVLSLLGNRL